MKIIGFGRTGKEMFGANYDRLVELKRKYDPENMFDKFAGLFGSEQEVLQNGIWAQEILVSNAVYNIFLESEDM